MKAPGDGPEQVLGAGKDCGDTPASHDWVCTGHVRDREGKFKDLRSLCAGGVVPGWGVAWAGGWESLERVV